MIHFRFCCSSTISKGQLIRSRGIAGLQSTSFASPFIHKRFASMATQKSFKFAGIQLMVSDDKAKNLENAREKIQEAAKNGAKLIALPECFNCPYSNDSFGPYSESIPDGISCKMLSDAAKENSVYLIGGSIPERDKDNKLYNTSTVYAPDGTLIAKHRKMHLFDIDIPGQITFQESKTLSAGNKFTIFETEFCKIGLGICYDIRFPEYALVAINQGCKFLCYPGAFNMTTGPAHWELLQRARAVDCQLYVAAVSPARNPKSSYQAWGHSTVCGPWGNVITTTDHDEAIIYADIDLDRDDQVRSQIPTSKQKRHDLYHVAAKP